MRLDMLIVHIEGWFLRATSRIVLYGAMISIKEAWLVKVGCLKRR